MQQKILITGGPGTGKTALINSLESRGYRCHHEIIHSNTIAFVDDPQAFNTNLLNGRIKQFVNSDTHKENIAFFDRGIPDVLAYMDFFNQQYSQRFIDACETHMYDVVFILPPWEAIYKTDDEAVAIHYHLEKTYIHFGYSLIYVPFESVENRLHFILDKLDIH